MDFPRFSRDLREVQQKWEDLGRAVAYARRKEGLSQKGLEARLKTLGTPVSDRTIRELEGGNPVGPSSVDRIGDALHWAPDTASAILQGLIEVGLAGEILPAESDTWPVRPRLALSGSGALTTVGSARPPLPPAWVPTLREARQAVADHERDLALAVEELKDHLGRMVTRPAGGDESKALMQITDALDIADKIDMAVRGANWWRAQVDALRREEEQPRAARKGISAEEREASHASDDPA